MPLEERRHKTLKRLHDRNCSWQQTVQLLSGSLTVDRVLIFAVKDGYVCKSGRSAVSNTKSFIHSYIKNQATLPVGRHTHNRQIDRQTKTANQQKHQM